jgi:hypothetical protein
LKGKKLSNISKAVFIVGSSAKTVRKVRGAFIINNLKIIRRKVHCLACLTAFQVLCFYKVPEVIIVSDNLDREPRAFKVMAPILKYLDDR